MAPQRPAQPGQPAATARPASPVQSTGVIRPSAPGVGRPATPHEPVAPAQEYVAHDDRTAVPQSHDQVASGLESVVTDEGDDVNVPPPPMEYLGQTHHATPTNPAFAPKYYRLGYKQTIIPILLTTGLCSAIIGACRFVLPRDTPLGNLPMFIPIILFVAAAAAILFGVLTMLQVKHTLEEQAAAQAAAAGAEPAAD